MSTHWNASLHFGVGQLNVVVTPLVSKAQGDEISFNLLHHECGHRISKPSFCPHCDRMVGPEEIERGYQYAKGQYVRISDAELDSVTKERSSEIVMRKFVPYASVLPDFYDKGYWLTPVDLPTQQRNYATVWRSLAQERLCGVGALSLTGKEHACVVVPNESALRLYTLRDASTLTRPEIPGLPPVKKDELVMTRDYIVGMVGQLEHSDLRTETSDARRTLIDAKLAGIEILPQAALPAPEDVPDLMDVLRAQVAPKRTMKKVAAK